MTETSEDMPGNAMVQLQAKFKHIIEQQPRTRGLEWICDLLVSVYWQAIL